MSYNLEEWAKMDVQLANKLTQLKELDVKRDDILNRASKLKDLTPSIRKEMDDNLASYKALAEEVVALKRQAKSLKSINGKKNWH